MISLYDFHLYDVYSAMGIERSAKMINDFSPFLESCFLAFL